MRRCQLRSSPRSSSENGFIFPRSRPKVSSILCLRCCVMNSCMVSSRVCARSFWRSLSNILSVFFVTLMVVVSLIALAYICILSTGI